MEKTIEILGAELDISGKPVKIPVKLKANANVPRMYRIWFRRDIIKDMQELQKSAEAVNENGEEFTIDDLSIFENVAFCMARLGDIENTPKDIDAWLEQFSTFSIYEVLPEILELWNMNLETTSESKKKLNQLTGK